VTSACTAVVKNNANEKKIVVLRRNKSIKGYP